MSCSTWQELAAAGEALLEEGSVERRRAESHLRSCPACAAKAFLLDPSWAVRSLPRAEFDPREVAELKRAVTGGERIRDLAGRLGSPWRRGRTAAAAALVLLAGVAALLSLPGQPAPSASVEAESGADRARSASAQTLELSLPAIGSVAPAAARVYEIGEEEFALVMVVHETLDL